MAIVATLTIRKDEQNITYFPLMARREKDLIILAQRNEAYFLDSNASNALANGKTIIYKPNDPLPILFSERQLVYPIGLDKPKDEYPKQYINITQIPDKLTWKQKLIEIWMVLKS